MVASYSGLQTTSKTIPAGILAEDGAYTWRVFANAGSSSLQSTSIFTLNVTQTDEWLVATPGINGSRGGKNKATVFYKPVTGNLLPLSPTINIPQPEQASELLPAVGDVELTYPGKEIVLGTGIDGTNEVYIYASDRTTFIRKFTAFQKSENPSGRVHVAIGDVDTTNPGNEIIAGTGSDHFFGGTHAGINQVKVFTGEGQHLVASSFSPAFGLNPSGEVWVAAGDLLSSLPGDEIVCGPGPWNQREALIYNNGTIVGSIFGSPILTPNTRDIAVAVGDFSPTNSGNEILASGLYNPNEVHLYSQGGTLLQTCSAFTTQQNPTGNIYVGGGRIDGDSNHELLAGTSDQS